MIIDASPPGVDLEIYFKRDVVTSTSHVLHVSIYNRHKVKFDFNDSSLRCNRYELKSDEQS